MAAAVLLALVSLAVLVPAVALVPVLAPAGAEPTVVEDTSAPPVLVAGGAVLTLVSVLGAGAGAAAVLLLVSVLEGAVVDGADEVEAVVAVLSSLRPQPASAKATAIAELASMSFLMVLSLLYVSRKF